jgi:hypothetical protein
VSTQANTSQRRNNEYSMMGRVGWTLPFSLASLMMFAWGLWSYHPYHLSLDHGTAQAGKAIQQYDIAVVNKRYEPGAVHLEVLGLQPGDFSLDATELALGAVEHRRVSLHISEGLPRGLYRVILRARSQDGWQEDIPFQHLASP